MPERGTVIRVLPGNRAVIMSSRCEFKEIRVGSGVKPGDEVVYSPEDVCGRQPPLRAAAMVASFLLFCLIAWSAFQHIASARVYARIAFQINPGLEITLDRSLRVRGASAFDREGEALVKGAALTGLSIDDAVSRIVGFCLRQGYLERGVPNYMAVSLYSPDEAGFGRLLQRLDEKLAQELEGGGVEAYVYYLRVDRAEWRRAQKLRVSPIAYILRERGKIQVGNRATSVSLKNPSLREAASRLAVKIRHSQRKRKVINGAEDALKLLQGGERSYPPKTEVAPETTGRKPPGEPVAGEGGGADAKGASSGQMRGGSPDFREGRRGASSAGVPLSDGEQQANPSKDGHLSKINSESRRSFQGGGWKGEQ
ncbi:MAG: anti-sigma factor domain-containing protein [Thermacetogeniaceae bacterium]